MILQRFNLIIIILPIFFLVAFLLWRYFRKSHNYILEFWFLKTSAQAYISQIFLIISLIFLSFALLDLRGEEEKVSAQIPEQKTIILIDSSLSMLTEDVRPNRFLKAIQVARHLVKNSTANQFSVFIFADTFQRILPFTDDIDLVDSRLAALESLATVRGSSNIGFTIKGMIPYFQTDAESENVVGNILLITDGEDHEKEEKLNLPSGISLAVVGVGTVKGGQIPIRWNDGSFKGFKTVSGVPVTSRLNENYIKKLGNSITDFDYWIVNSFNLPTQEINDFFRAKFISGGTVGEVRSRKAYGEYPMAAFVFFYMLSVVFARFKTFKNATAILAFIFMSNILFGQRFTMAEEERKLSEATLKNLEKIKNGEANRSEILKTAEQLLKEDFPESAKKLYEEHLSADDSVEVVNNYATSLVKSNNASEGIKKYQEILERKDLSLEQAKAIRKNLLSAIQKKKMDDNQKSEDKKNDQKNSGEGQNQKSKDQGNSNQEGKGSSDSEEKNESDKNKSDKSSNSKDGNQKKSGEERDLRDLMDKDKKAGDKNQEKEDSKKSEDKNESKNEKENKQNKDKEKNEKENKGEGDKDKSPESFEEREERMKRQRKMKKTPAILKQTLDLDRELQKKFLDASKEKIENGKAESPSAKDW